MIPIRLEMKNFLPYRSPDPLYFEGIHLACLTGHNGAGKSSLLDAITWALWGKARSHRDDDLIHLGQDEMHVVLDFEQEGVRYRVNRGRTAGKRGQGTLTVFTIKADGSLQNVREPSMRETQNTINRILRLDYETFINSAYLQQGKADAFTTKRPAERKRILSDILGLADWRTYEDRTKERLKQIERHIAALDGAINEINQQLQREPQHRADLERYSAEYEAADAELTRLTASLQEIAHAENDLKNTQQQQSDLTRRLADYRRDLQAAADEITQRQNTVDTYQALIDQRTDIEDGYRSLKDAQQANRALSDVMRQDGDYAERLSRIQRQIDAISADKHAEQRNLQTRLAALAAVMGGDHAQALASVQADIAQLQAIQTQRDTANDAITQLREERGAIESEFKTLKQQGDELNERIETLENSDEGTCPLCGQTLNDEHRQQVIDETTADRDMLRDQWAQNRARQSEIDADIQQLQAQVREWGTALADLPRLQGQEGTLMAQLAQAQAAASEHENLTHEAEQLARIIAEADYAHELRQQYAQLAQERASLAYDDSQHDALNTQIDTYSKYEREYLQLEQAENQLPHEMTMLENARGRHARFAEAIRRDEATLQDLAADIEALKRLRDEYRRREQDVNKQRKIVNDINELRISAEQALKALHIQRQRRQQKADQLAAAREDEALYKELRYAFGKDGVPAMIIESAIPELEASANQLLARMTDGRMHLRLTTQASKADGSLRETLNIDIADELGTRPYELYSGGESFRINFALRVALSEMLARRAGAHLRTLFIDEGFGTQDDDGRNKLVEAITAIQDNFDLILVITHIDELRDAFPVHIVVDKLGSGSSIMVR